MYNGKDKGAKLVGAVALARRNQLKNLNAIQEIMAHRMWYEDGFHRLIDMAAKYLKE